MHIIHSTLTNLLQSSLCALTPVHRHVYPFRCPCEFHCHMRGVVLWQIHLDMKHNSSDDDDDDDDYDALVSKQC